MARRTNNRRNTKRRSSGKRSTNSNRRNKFNLSKVVQALVIESLAVAAILALFFGMRSDLKNQSRNRLENVDRYYSTERFPSTVAMQNGHFAAK